MRNQSPSFRIYVTPEEKERIRKAANDCRLSMSAYCKTLALGGEPASRFDIAQVEKFEKAVADLSRLGNLLKMTLTNDERLEDMGREMGVATIDGTLVDIRTTSAKLKELVDLVHGGRLGNTRLEIAPQE